MIYDILFPTVVARSGRKDLVEPIKNIIQSLDVFEGWRGNANTDLHILDSYPEIKEQFENEMRFFLHDKMGYGCDLKMTTSWFTKIEPNGTFYTGHNHKNSWFSGCFYLQNDCQIQFDNDNESQIYVVPKEEHELNSSSCVYTTNAGTLIMFPSQTMHSALVNKDWNKTRYSLAFNVMPVGEVGTGDSTYTY